MAFSNIPNCWNLEDIIYNAGRFVYSFILQVYILNIIKENFQGKGARVFVYYTVVGKFLCENFPNKKEV